MSNIQFINKYLKWLSTFLVLTGILLTNLNMYPINIMFHCTGVVGWTIAGFLSKDKAILTNFGLQIPLFLIGFYQLIF
jgi:hypothetical protein